MAKRLDGEDGKQRRATYKEQRTEQDTRARQEGRGVPDSTYVFKDGFGFSSCKPSGVAPFCTFSSPSIGTAAAAAARNAAKAESFAGQRIRRRGSGSRPTFVFFFGGMLCFRRRGRFAAH